MNIEGWIVAAIAAAIVGFIAGRLFKRWRGARRKAATMREINGLADRFRNDFGKTLPPRQ